jgi:phosphatidylglycerol:prolipoprotein diacylglycerol transferase
LWGRPTGSAWGIVFHRTGNDVARHPSQLYEAGLEGIVLFAILWFAFWRTKARYEPGKLVGLFILGYGVARYIVEFFREPDSQYMDNAILGTAGLHMGQLLCVPMVVGGIYLVWTAKGRRQRVTPIAGDDAVA